MRSKFAETADRPDLNRNWRGPRTSYESCDRRRKQCPLTFQLRGKGPERPEEESMRAGEGRLYKDRGVKGPWKRVVGKHVSRPQENEGSIQARSLVRFK